MGNFYKRSVTGLFIVGFIIASILLGKISFLFLCLLIIYFCIQEFYTLASFENVKPQKYYGTVLSLIIFIVFYLFYQNKVDEIIFVPIIPLTISVFLLELFRKEKHPFLNIAFTILGIVYIAIPISLFNYFVFSSGYTIIYKPDLLFGFFILIWIYDTGAYVSGLLFGSTPLFPRISPKKTWEGLIGGTIFSLAAAWMISKFYQDYSVFDWIIIAFITVIMGTFGDLTESMFKRSVAVKESGHLLPGHGGMLDRFDGVLFAAPFIYTYLKLMY